MSWGGYVASATLAATAGSPQPDATFNSSKVLGAQKAEKVMAGGALKMDEALLNAKLEAVEARTDSKFAQLLGELKVISANVTSLGTQISDVKAELTGVKSATASVKWNILATGLAIGGLIIAIAGFGASILQWTAALVGLHK